MKKLIVMMLIFGATEVNAQEKVKQDFKKLHWLSGNWIRTNVKAGQTAQENWTLVTPEKLTGTASTKNGKKVIFEEKLSLTIENGNIIYTADVTGNKAPVPFKLTSIGNNTFTCENPINDFPKKITYTLNGNKLLATISGGGKNVDFHFERKL